MDLQTVLEKEGVKGPRRKRKFRRKDLQAAGVGEDVQCPNFAVPLDLLASFENKRSYFLRTQPSNRH